MQMGLGVMGKSQIPVSRTAVKTGVIVQGHDGLNFCKKSNYDEIESFSNLHVLWEDISIEGLWSGIVLFNRREIYHINQIRVKFLVVGQSYESLLYFLNSFSFIVAAGIRQQGMCIQ